MTPTRAKVLRLVLANLAVSVVFALLTLLLHDSVLSYQEMRHPGADPAALSRTLWTRPATVLCVALLYVRLVGQLRSGAARALRRIRIVSGLGVPVLGWLLVTAEYPGWLRAVQVLQLVVLAALAVTVNTRTVRSAFDVPAPADPRPRHRRAAWTLVLLAPVVAELSLGNIPLSQAWVFPVFVPVYGAGALLIREVVRRTGGGLTAMLLLGVAYGLVEEGLALQSLTSPHLYGAAGWAPRLLGLNTAYTELNLVYHPVFSITIPIILTELLFAGHGERPYLRRGGLIVTGAIAALGALLLRVAVPPGEDPGYTLPPVAAAVILAAASLVTVAALRGRTGRSGPCLVSESDRSPGRIPQRGLGSRRSAAPSPAVIAVGTGAATFSFLALLFPFAGAERSFFTHGSWTLLPMAAAAAIVAGAGVTLRRWSSDPAWTPAHLAGAALAAVAGHTLFGLVANTETVLDRLFLGALTVGTVVLCGWSVRRVRNGPAPAVELQEADR